MLLSSTFLGQSAGFSWGQDMLCRVGPCLREGGRAPPTARVANTGAYRRFLVSMF